MNMEDKIKKAIEDSFSPEHFQLVNESHKHKGHAGDDGSGQTHFQLLVVSRKFENCNRVQRQRMVNEALAVCFEEGLHALSMTLSTPEEFN